MVVSLTNTTELSDPELRVFNHEKLKSVQDRVKIQVADFLMAIFRLNMINKRAAMAIQLGPEELKLELAKLTAVYGGETIKEDPFLGKFALINSIKRELTSLKKAFVFLECNVFDASDISSKIENQHLKQFKEICSNFDRAVNIKKKLKQMQTIQSSILKETIDAHKRQNCIARMLIELNKLYKTD